MVDDLLSAEIGKWLTHRSGVMREDCQRALSRHEKENLVRLKKRLNCQR